MGNREQAVQFVQAAIQAAKDANNPQVAHGFQLLASAVNADPTYGEAFFHLGNALSDQNVFPAAIATWRRGLECQMTDEERAKFLINMGWRLYTSCQIEEAFAVTVEATKLAPKQPYGWINLGCIHGALDSSVVALGCAKKAYELDPKDPVVEMGLAFAYLFDRQFAKGLKHFESRFPYKLKNFLHYPYPKWLGEPDKSIFLVADQGLGDTLSFARFVKQAAKRAKYIHACIQPELLRVFQHAFMDIPNINLLPSPCNFPAADAWSTFVSLPFALGLTDDEFIDCPGISMPLYDLPTTWKIPDRKLHIGIAYAGSPANDINQHRSIPLAQFLDLYQTPGIQLYSLQCDERKIDVHDQGCAGVVKDLSPYIRDVCSTVSLLKELDLVICIESALGHIAGMMGKECWIPYSHYGRDYRAGITGENPIWYKNHRFFRQGPDQDWSKVFDKINIALGNRLRERHVQAAE